MTTTHRYISTVSFQEDTEGKIISSSDTTISNSVETNVTVTLPDGTTDQQHTVTINDSKVKSFYMLSTQDLLVETNDGGSPDVTFNLSANEPFYWHINLGIPIASVLGGNDLDDLFLTNSSGTSADFIFRSIRSA